MSVAYRDSIVLQTPLGGLQVYNAASQNSDPTTIEGIVKNPQGHASNNYSLGRGVDSSNVIAASPLLRGAGNKGGLGMVDLEKAQVMAINRPLTNVVSAIEPMPETATLVVHDSLTAGTFDTRTGDSTHGLDITFLTRGTLSGLAVCDRYASMVNAPLLRSNDGLGKGVIVFENTGLMAFDRAIPIAAIDVHQAIPKGIDMMTFSAGQGNADSGRKCLAVLVWNNETVTVVFADVCTGMKMCEATCVLPVGTIVMSAHLSASHGRPGNIFANVLTRSRSGLVFPVRDPDVEDPSGVIHVMPLSTTADPENGDGDYDGIGDLETGGGLWQNVIAWGGDPDHRANGLLVACDPVAGPGANNLIRTWAP